MNPNDDNVDMDAPEGWVALAFEDPRVDHGDPDEVTVPDDEDDDPVEARKPKAIKGGKGEMPLPGYEPRFRNADMGVGDFPSLDDFIDELSRNSMELSRLWGYTFWHNNDNLYSVSSLDWEDLSHHLYEKAWLGRYEPRIRKNPGQYTVRSFRANFYVGVHNTAKVHRRYLLAKCRMQDHNTVVSLNGRGRMDEDGSIDVAGPPVSPGFWRESADYCRYLLSGAGIGHDHSVVGTYLDDRGRIKGFVNDVVTVTGSNLVRLHLLVALRPNVYNSRIVLARRFFPDDTTATANAKLAVMGKQLTATENMGLDKEQARAIVMQAKQRGLIVQKSAAEQADETLRTMGKDGAAAAATLRRLPNSVAETVWKVLKDVSAGRSLSDAMAPYVMPTGKAADRRVDAFGDVLSHAAGLDFEILGATFGLELNAEVNPVIAYSLIRSRLDAMPSDERAEILDHPYVGRLVDALSKFYRRAATEPVERSGCAVSRTNLTFNVERIDGGFAFNPVGKGMVAVWKDLRDTVTVRSWTAVMELEVEEPSGERGGWCKVRGTSLRGMTVLQFRDMVNGLARNLLT